MELCVIGTGYVGLVVGTCFADLGFSVTCVDHDPDKIRGLQAGQVPIYEPGLDGVLRRGMREGRLHFSTEGGPAVAEADVVFIAVGTPGRADGSADLGGVYAVCDTICAHARRPLLVVIKSTVPVGTADAVRARLSSCNHIIDVVSNPEFLKEGAALDDFMRPDRIVIGCSDPRARDAMSTLYAGLVRTGRPILFMDNRSAELAKYASNALLATKISFMNELSRLCEVVGADVERVRLGVGADTRIGPRFLFAGAGYGGSCFPKDVAALLHGAHAQGVELGIVRAVERANERQKHVLAEKVIARYGGALAGRRVALWGVAFKPETDDVREAPALVIAARLLDAGAQVVAYDPEARDTAARALDGRVTFASTALEAAEGAHALVLVTEWNEFRNPDFAAPRERMAAAVLFDGRNIYDPAQVRAEGFEYFGIGRP